jgi:opacity protein-like surface antigen
VAFILLGSGQDAREASGRKESPVRRVILSLALAATFLSGAVPAAAGGLDLRIGGFFPRGEETLFQDVRELYLVDKSDFYGVYGGVEFNSVVTRNLELGVSFDAFGSGEDTSYRDYVRPDGREIQQTLKLRMYPLGVTLRVLPTRKSATFVPFVGGGVDAVFYDYEEYGDFIDFFDPDLPVVPDAFEADGTAFGFHAVAGFRYYVNRDFAVVAEGRYQWAEDDMGDDFAPNPESGLVNRIDLSGPSFTVGLHIRF